MNMLDILYLALLPSAIFVFISILVYRYKMRRLATSTYVVLEERIKNLQDENKRLNYDLQIAKNNRVVLCRKNT